MSSNRVPGPTWARSNSASLTRRAYGSTRYAQSAGRSPQGVGKVLAGGDLDSLRHADSGR